MVGGIQHFSWVMEEQDRGSPHIHMILWTGKTLDELMAIDHLIVAWLLISQPLTVQLYTAHRYQRCQYPLKGKYLQLENEK